MLTELKWQRNVKSDGIWWLRYHRGPVGELHNSLY